MSTVRRLQSLEQRIVAMRTAMATPTLLDSRQFLFARSRRPARVTTVLAHDRRGQTRMGAVAAPAVVSRRAPPEFGSRDAPRDDARGTGPTAVAINGRAPNEVINAWQWISGRFALHATGEP